MPSVSKSVYIDKLNDIVNKYNNTCHRTIKIKPVDIKDNTYINTDREVITEIINLKLVIM